MPQRCATASLLRVVPEAPRASPLIRRASSPLPRLPIHGAPSLPPPGACEAARPSSLRRHGLAPALMLIRCRPTLKLLCCEPRHPCVTRVAEPLSRGRTPHSRVAVAMPSPPGPCARRDSVVAAATSWPPSTPGLVNPCTGKKKMEDHCGRVPRATRIRQDRQDLLLYTSTTPARSTTWTPSTLDRQIRLPPSSEQIPSPKTRVAKTPSSSPP